MFGVSFLAYAVTNHHVKVGGCDVIRLRRRAINASTSLSKCAFVWGRSLTDLVYPEQSQRVSSV